MFLNCKDLAFFEGLLVDLQKQEKELQKIELTHSSGILELHTSKLTACTYPCLQELKTFVNTLLPK